MGSVGIDNCDNDNMDHATNALVFMAVGINSNWKLPLGYFLVKCLSGSDRANLMQKWLELLNEAGVKVHSITFDGAHSN